MTIVTVVRIDILRFKFYCTRSYCLSQTCLPATNGATSSVVFVQSTSTKSTFYSAFTAMKRLLPAAAMMEVFPVPLISWPMTCAWFTLTLGRGDHNRTLAVTASPWVPCDLLDQERSSGLHIVRFPTRSISACRSPASNRTDCWCLRIRASWRLRASQMTPWRSLPHTDSYRSASLLWVTFPRPDPT